MQLRIFIIKDDKLLMKLPAINVGQLLGGK
jgi:hypothetical protein